MCNRKRPSGGDLLADVATGVRSHFEEFTDPIAHNNVAIANIDNRYFAIFTLKKNHFAMFHEFNLRALVMDVT